MTHSVRFLSPQWPHGTARRAVLTAALLLLACLPSAGANPPPDKGAVMARAKVVERRPAAERDSALTVLQRDVALLQSTSVLVRSFLADSLDAKVDPGSLFDIDLGDQAALVVEASRLRAVIGHATDPSPAKSAARAGAAAKGSGAGVDPQEESLFQARLGLDRARLAVYSLSSAERDTLRIHHATRAELAGLTPDGTGPNNAEQRARQAVKEQQLALAASRQARTEAERLVAEEHARLLGIAGAQADFETRLEHARQSMEQRADQTLVFQRRVREVGEVADPASADALYLELRTFLRSLRDALAAAINATSGASEVPDAGEDRLGDLPLDVNRSVVSQARLDVQRAAERLRAAERALRLAAAGQLYQEVRSLNRDRLTLLDQLSGTRRTSVTSFGPAGFNQALAELRQVTLLLSYHLMSTREWLADIVHLGSARAHAAVAGGLVLVKWCFALLAFVWWRRRSPGLLAQLRERLQAESRRARAVRPSRLDHFLGFLQQTRRPLEWLVLVWLLIWLLPDGARSQLEVILASTVFFWILGGSLAVTAINSLAGSEEWLHLGMGSTAHSGLRLRSLRLIGRTVVVFGLILALSSKLVGHGTIYGWVFSVCWFAALPVVLVIVRWWRDSIFERIRATRKPKAFEQWVAANQSGWRSFPATVAAAAYFFARGSARALRNWVGRFDLTRRALAYLFRRGLDRLAGERQHLAFKPLPAGTIATLGPKTPSGERVPGLAEEQVIRIVERVNRAGGGVFAVVGERGSGKTTVLGRVRDTRPDVTMVECPTTGLESLRLALAESLQLDPSASLEECATARDTVGQNAAMIIDDAHRLILPVMGGLDAFDRLTAVARNSSSTCAWFFAFDRSIWRFFERARGARPLFDDVIELGAWREEEIVSLLTARCVQAGIEPSFEHLLDTLPADADEIDRADALVRAGTGYHRLLWDYSDGNPGVALHAWLRSLGLDEEGRVCVKFYQTPDTRELEQLPNAVIFVLRAVFQLEPALPEDVARATMLPMPQVENALRYALARGYFAQDGERYIVTWDWFRAISRFLQRRHL